MTLLPDAERASRLRLGVALMPWPEAAVGLADAFGSAEAALARSPGEWSRTGLVSSEAASRAASAAQGFDAEGELRELAELGGRLVLIGEEGYPSSLACVPDAPPFLYIMGELPEVPALALVGARRPTAYGLRMAARFARDAARCGVAVVSGLARGIDTAAHLAALEAGGRTWAVLGSGFLQPYPRENRGLLSRIVEAGGAVVTEFPLKTPPLKHNFPRRNRIISGLTLGTVVVEGTLKSGALITAKAALDQGREVFAVPGPADSGLSQGPHHLLKQGAAVAERLEDVLAAFPWPAAGPSQSSGHLGPQSGCSDLAAPGPVAELRAPGPVAELRAPGPVAELRAPGAAEPLSRAAEPLIRAPEAPSRPLWQALGEGSPTLDELAFATGWDAPKLSRALTELELQGLVRAMPGRRFART